MKFGKCARKEQGSCDFNHDEVDKQTCRNITSEKGWGSEEREGLLRKWNETRGKGGKNGGKRKVKGKGKGKGNRKGGYGAGAGWNGTGAGAGWQ